MDANRKDSTLGAVLDRRTEEVSLIGDMCASVIRDRAISSAYGCYIDLCKQRPAPSDFFSETVCKKLYTDFKRNEIDVSKVDLYSGMGDLYSQLARLLIVCKETKSLTPYYEAANIKIEECDFGIEMSCDSDYIRHFRNSIVHCRVSREIMQDPMDSLIVFEDICRKGGQEKRTALYKLNARQINWLINLLLQEVLLAYLSNSNWKIGT